MTPLPRLVTRLDVVGFTHTNARTVSQDRNVVDFVADQHGIRILCEAARLGFEAYPRFKSKCKPVPKSQRFDNPWPGDKGNDNFRRLGINAALDCNGVGFAELWRNDACNRERIRTEIGRLIYA